MQLALVASILAAIDTGLVVGAAEQSVDGCLASEQQTADAKQAEAEVK